MATPESKPPPMSRAKSVRKAAAKLTGIAAPSGKKADAPPKAEKAAAADARGRAPVADKFDCTLLKA